ncbi:28327_t:CDS:2, partial [Dentiscutata erythropus]
MLLCFLYCEIGHQSKVKGLREQADFKQFTKKTVKKRAGHAKNIVENGPYRTEDRAVRQQVSLLPYEHLSHRLQNYSIMLQSQQNQIETFDSPFDVARIIPVAAAGTSPISDIIEPMVQYLCPTCSTFRPNIHRIPNIVYDNPYFNTFRPEWTQTVDISDASLEDQQNQANGSQGEVRNWNPVFVTTPTLNPEYLYCNQQSLQ